MRNYYLWFAKLALFVLVFLVSDYFFGMVVKALDKQAVKMNPIENKTSYLLNDVNSDVLIIGASEVEFSFRPDILMDSLGMSVYNCGKNGQRLYYQTVVVNSIIDRYSPKFLIWSVAPNYLTPHQSDFDKISVFKPYYRENVYCRELLQKRSWSEKYKMLSYFYTYNSEFHTHILNVIRPVYTNTIYGYRPIPDGNGTPLLEEEQLADQPEELSVTLFENTLGRLSDKGIQAVFVFSPRYTKGDYHNMDSYNLLKEIINRNGFILVEDYYHHPSLMHDYYFRDKDHLTEKGVDVFSKMIAHRLSSLIKR